VVDPTQLLSFCLATEKAQMVMQLAVPRILGDNFGVPVTCDPPPAVLLRFKFHLSCRNDTHARSGGIWTHREPFAACGAHPTGEGRGGFNGRGSHSAIEGSSGQRGGNAGRGGNHCRNDYAISREISKSFEPTGTIAGECLPLEEGGVESVSKIYEFLEIFQSDLGRVGRTAQILEETIKTVGPETNDDVVLVGYISQRARNTRGERDLQKVEHHLGKTGNDLRFRQTGTKKKQNLQLVILDRFLPPRLLRIFAPDRWATFDEDAVLILRFSRIIEKLCLENAHIAIKLLELTGKGVPIGIVTRLVVVEERGWGGRVIGGTGRKGEI
jgi:hypothetical protein